MKRKRHLLVPMALAAALAGFPAAVFGQAPPPADPSKPDPVLARAYEIRFRSLEEAAQLVARSGVLSDQGVVSMQPGQRTLVVQDRASILDRVRSLLESFDVPPRSVELTVTLFLGSDERQAQAGKQAYAGEIAREVGGVIETLADFTRWTNYSILGAQFVTGLEGSKVEMKLSEEYRAVFEVGAVQDRPPLVRLKNFTLQHVSRTADGRERVENRLVLDVDLPFGKFTTVGAAKNPESRRALFLAFQARAR